MFRRKLGGMLGQSNEKIVCFLLEIFWNLLDIANLLKILKVSVAILNSIRKEKPAAN